MKKLFIISELFYPNKTSTAYIMTELADHLANSYDVTVLTTDVKYDDNISIEIDKTNFSIIRSKVGKVDKNSFLSRVKGAANNSFMLMKLLLKHVKNEDKVLVVTNPFLIIFFIAVIRTFKKINYTLLVHDVFPENTIPARLNEKKNISYKLLKVVFDWSYSKADKVIVLGEDMMKLLINKGVDSSSIQVITNWFDDDTVSTINIDRERYLGISNLEEKIVIGFAGNVGRVQGLDNFISCLKKVNNDRLVFVIIGDGAELEELKEMSKDFDNIVFLGSKPRNEQSLFLNCFDVGLVTLAKGMFGLGVPSKSYNILKSGKPILYIGDSSSEIDLTIKKYSCGWSFSWDQKQQLIDFLEGLKFENVIEFRKKNETLANDFFSKEIIMKQFESVFDSR